PFRNAMVEAGYPPKLHVWEPTGAFMLYLKVSFYCGLLLSAPWILYQMWKFVAAGLYPHERRSITIILPAAGSLFIVGAAFCVLLIISPAVEFFVAFNKLLQVEPIITIGSYVKFVISLMLAFGLAFQTPLVIFVLARLGLVSVGTLRKYRKHVIIVILTLSAMLTPPDIFSQVALAVPIFLLYEVGVLLARWFGKPRLELDEQ
ncbi:MAG: twin-arginine translocase subunit TatC, partial [Phycisphaerae bacterium]